MLAHRPDRAGWQAYFGALDLVAGFLAGLGDVGGADRSEELAFAAGLRRDAELESFERGRARPGGREVGGGLRLELGAPALELGDVLRRREGRLASRQQEVAPESRLDFHAIADVTDVGDLLQQDDFHRLTLLAAAQSARESGSTYPRTRCPRGPSAPKSGPGRRARPKGRRSPAARAARARPPAPGSGTPRRARTRGRPRPASRGRRNGTTGCWPRMRRAAASR